jgi:SanA protein
MGWTEQSRIVVESAGLLPHPVALVFGAGLQPDGKPSGVLAERVVAAVQLYKAGKVRKLLMSGDNGSSGYDEPTAMRDYAVALGVPADDVARDFAGFRSYDTCYRARDIFGLRQVVLVSQAYHLPRVLFIARALKLDAVGFAAPTRAPLRWQLSWRLREVPARSAAVLDCLVRRRPRFLGKPEPLLARSTSD